MASIANIQKAYLAYFGRPVDFTGSISYQATTEAAMYAAFATSAESVALYGTTFGATQVNAIYLALFNRTAEPAGITYWVDQVVNRGVTPAGAAIAILNGAQNADAVAITNKLAASAAFTAALDTTPEIVGYSGDAAAAAARAFLSTITATAATQAAIDAAVVTATTGGGSGGVAGQTFTLTTGVDAIAGTVGNDTVNALIDFNGGTTAGSLTTLNSSDTVALGAGTSDTLNVILRNASGAAIGSATTAVAQVNTYTFAGAIGAAADLMVVNYGGVSTTIITGANVTSQALAVSQAINAMAGATIATVLAGVMTVTAPVAGTPLPAIGFTSATTATEYPTVAITANVPGAGGAISLGTVSGVETLAVQNVSGSAVTLSAAQAPLHTTFVADRSTSALTVTNLANGAAVTINGDGAATESTLTATYTGTATTAGALSVTNGVNSGLVTFTPNSTVASVTVNSTGGAQAAAAGQVNTLGGLTLPTNVTSLVINATTSLTTGTITDASLVTITASGAATTVNIGTAPAAVTTIDGSGLTAGGVTTTLTAAVTSFKGGAGVDTVTTGATTAATAVIDGGAGAADILNLAATNDVTTTAKAAQYVNFEVLRNTTATNVDMSLFSTYTSVQAAATGAGFTNMTAGQANAVTIRTTDAGATFALANSAGTSDVLRVTLNNSTTTTGPVTAANLTTATVNGFETMNVVSSSGTNGSVSALSFTAATDLTALNITGVAPLSLTTTNIAKGVAIDASAMSFVPTTGNATFAITGNLIKGSVVTATGAADSITTTAAVTGTTGDFVTYSAGAGVDAISSTVAAINNTSAGNASVKIDGGTGIDTLTLTDTGLTMVDANFQFLTGIEAITNASGNNAVSVTSGGFFDTNFKAAGVTLTLGAATNAAANTVNLSTFTGNAIVSFDATAASTALTAITTGTGNDTVTLLAAGTTTAAHTVSTGAGNDTINVTISGTTITTGTVTINGGAGLDTITITGNTTVNADAAPNVVFVVNEGNSTLTASDVINGWVLNAATKVANYINVDGTGVAAADAASAVATGFANVNYSITSGLMAFTGTGAAGLSAANKATIAQTFVTAVDASVAFTDGANTYVFHNGVVTDDLITLVGVAGLGLVASASTTTTGFINVI